MGLVSILLHSFLFSTDKNHGATLTNVLSNAVDWRLLTWHPLYNAFSMITLGFCSALTHSLLNAGKRVFAICMAIFWFRESHGWATIVSLAAVMVGGCWYATEVKATGRVASSSSWTVRIKSLGSLMLLILVYAFVRLESKNK
jgi:ABC-type proline/glycine betaine transport system permease subunit